MGTGSRVFFITDSDEIIKIPVAKFHRIYDQDPNEKMPQYKNSRIRYVYISLNTKNRMPVSIWRTDHSYLTFDGNGRVDTQAIKDVRGKSISLLSYALDQPTIKKGSKLIDAKSIFEKRRIKHAITWEPSEELEKAIYDKIFCDPTIKKRKNKKKIRVEISTDLELPDGWEIIEWGKYGHVLKYKKKFYDFSICLLCTKSLDGLISWEGDEQMDEELRKFFINQTIGIEELK